MMELKPIWPNDKAFYEKVLADDWTGGDSGGAWYTKAELLKLYDDPEHNKTSSEKISELKVRVYGNTASQRIRTHTTRCSKANTAARTGDRHRYVCQDGW